MKTLQPKDYSKTPEQYQVESHMGKSQQWMYLYRLVFFGFVVWLVVVSAAGLWAAFLEAIK